MNYQTIKDGSEWKGFEAMGKYKIKNELQDYLDDIKEHQEHQYCRGYWVGKVPRYFPGREGLSLGKNVSVIIGIILVITSVIFLIRTCESKGLSDVEGLFSLFGAILPFLIGVVIIWENIKRN